MFFFFFPRPLYLNYILDEETLAHTGILSALLCRPRDWCFTCPLDTTEPFHGFQSRLTLITPWPPPVFPFSSCDWMWASPLPQPPIASWKGALDFHLAWLCRYEFPMAAGWDLRGSLPPPGMYAVTKRHF